MQRPTRIHTWGIPPLLALGVQTVFAHDANVCFQGIYNSIDDLKCALIPSTSIGIDVVVMDFLRTCELSTRMFAEVKSAHEHVRIIFLLSQNPDETTVIRALRLGAEGYLTHSSTPDSVEWAVKSLAAGKCYLEPQVTPLVLEELRKPAMIAHESDVQVDLTQRERALLQLAADGLNNHQVAELLGLRDKTIRNLWSTLFEKIRMSDRTQAVLWAIRVGYAELR